MVERDDTQRSVGLLIRWEDDAIVLAISGPLDAAGTALVEDALDAILESEPTVTVDLRGVPELGADVAAVLGDAARRAPGRVRVRSGATTDGRRPDRPRPFAGQPPT